MSRMSLLRLLSLVLLEDRDSMEEREETESPDLRREEREVLVVSLPVRLAARMDLILLSAIPLVGWTMLLI